MYYLSPMATLHLAASSLLSISFVIVIYIKFYLYVICAIFPSSTVISWRDRTCACVLNVEYGMRCTCARALAIFHTKLWLMSVGKVSRSELKIKDIRRLTNTRWTDDAARMCLLSRQRGKNLWSRLRPEFDIDIIHLLMVWSTCLLPHSHT